MVREGVVARGLGGGGKPLRVAVLGAGNVGREVVFGLLSGWEGPTFDLVGVAVRDMGKAQEAGMPVELLTDAPAQDRKSTRLNSSHQSTSRMPSSA